MKKRIDILNNLSKENNFDIEDTVEEDKLYLRRELQNLENELATVKLDLKKMLRDPKYILDGTYMILKKKKKQLMLT